VSIADRIEYFFVVGMIIAWVSIVVSYAGIVGAIAVLTWLLILLRPYLWS
jgi:hypothetical protein